MTSYQTAAMLLNLSLLDEINSPFSAVVVKEEMAINQ